MDTRHSSTEMANSRLDVYRHHSNLYLTMNGDVNGSVIQRKQRTKTVKRVYRHVNGLKPNLNATNVAVTKEQQLTEAALVTRDTLTLVDDIRTSITSETTQEVSTLTFDKRRTFCSICNSNGLLPQCDCVNGLNICQYKLKCMVLDQGTMTDSRVHVDESEPTGFEEVPFTSRDVQVRNGCWVSEEYDVLETLLGRGKFGEVKQCKEMKSGQDFAAKFIDIACPSERLDVLNEIEMMKCLQHPRLLQLYDVFVKKNHFCLVLELISGGELFERVINDDFILTEKACIMFMRQICEGVEFMHNNSILHLDLKPENILCMTREGNRIKIIDFGLTRKYDPNIELRILFGTPEFMAPEQANFEPIYPATDMWSIGIICYILLSGLSPFLGEAEGETIANLSECNWDFDAEEFDSISNEAKDFITKLIVKEPKDRMTVSECLEHKWLRRSAKRERIPTRSLSTKRLRKFVYRRKWQKAVNAMLALKRMGVKL